MQMQINLLPVQYRPKPPVRPWPIAITIALMLNLIIISSYWLTLHFDLSQTKSDVHVLENEIATIQRRVDEAQWKAELEANVKSKANYIDAQLVASRLWNPALSAIERAMVPGLVIEVLDCSSSGDISISGVTDSVEVAADFWGSLQVETGLDIVRMNYIAPHEEFSVLLHAWYGREVQDVDE